MTKIGYIIHQNKKKIIPQSMEKRIAHVKCYLESKYKLYHTTCPQKSNSDSFTRSISDKERGKNRTSSISFGFGVFWSGRLS